MDPAIIGAFGGFIALLMTVLTAVMLHLDSKTDKRLAGIDARLDGIDARLDGIDERLNGIDERLNGIDERLNKMDERLNGIDENLGKLTLAVIQLAEAVGGSKERVDLPAAAAGAAAVAG